MQVKFISCHPSQDLLAAKKNQPKAGSTRALLPLPEMETHVRSGLPRAHMNMTLLMLATITSAETQIGQSQCGATPPIRSIDGSYVMFLYVKSKVGEPFLHFQQPAHFVYLS